jgi:YVTN family beta-propeller protein
MGEWARDKGFGLFRFSPSVFIASDPTGKFAYVANRFSNTVSAYSINASTGALTSIGTIAPGSYPHSIAITRVP